jgi:hypothetical protein
MMKMAAATPDVALDRETLDLHAIRRQHFGSKRVPFTEVDTFEGRASDPTQLHKYVYGAANPVMNVDPSGHNWELAGQLAVTGIKGMLLGAVLGAVGGAATGAYLHIVTFQRFDGVLDAAGRGALYGAIAGAIIGASVVNPTLLATTLSISFGISVKQSIPVLTDPNIPLRTKVAIISLLALQGTLSRGAIVEGLIRPHIAVPMTNTFAADLQQSFRTQVGNASDGVLGGYITAEGKPVLLPFTRGGIGGHSAGVAAGVIPSTARGGFSVIVNSMGQATEVLFRSSLNSADNDFYLPAEVQQQIVDGLPKASNFKVLE